ncbi:MAG: penicillin-binding protein 2 [Sphingobium sp.]|nr:penicillin-binding protein 2 [Sphingobium sp.]MBP6112165.1 penicillin-binding protein 2 [Sphingobium sp.]MBP8670363.1 penicillin-binding protein 2 [Sphingobium sp.]MBP9157675.1 penicillin-binding protein 2 [Sphingobium sp.]MCC6482870.1 penicillin-binding protein 2 [Sphingomonadaceae bacterium]
MATIVVRHDRPPMRRERLDLTAVAHQRLMLMLLLLAAVSALLVIRLAWMGISSGKQGEHNGALAGLPSRADIVDRNGVPLARMMDAYAISVRPDKLISDPAELARKLHEIFPDVPQTEFYTKLTGKGWAYLRHRALPEEVKAVNALGEIGIEFPREKERFYPQSTLAAHLLGFAPVKDGQNFSGGMGVEAAFNERLIDPARRGEPLALSLDARVQGALESELYSAMVDQKAKGATGIVLNANTGEVVAMASFPVFDPNKLGADADARRNNVVQARYELGSTFKPLSVAAAMDAGVVTSMAKTYDATAPLQVGGYKIKDDHPLGRWLNVPETLIHSSNIVTARIADEMGAGPMQKLYRALEFDRRPSIELKERFPSLWPADWGRITNMTVAYGHGIAVTPLHLASAYAALVNGGIWRPATLIRIEADQAPQGRRVFSAATSARMRQLLRLIVMYGTGRTANAPGYRIGGKTGTAEKPSAGGYAHHANITTFAAAFPMDNPQYVILAMMDEPQGSSKYPGVRTAAYTSAPVVKQVVTRIGPMLGILPDQRRDVDMSELMPLLSQDTGEN